MKNRPKSVAVIGAGISGVAAGAILKEKGYHVTVFEKYSKPGGLIRCDVVKGNLFHRVGGHVFNAKDKDVSDWFWSHFDKDKEFLKAERNAKILLNGKMIGYPLENHLYALKPDLVRNIVAELLALQRLGYTDPYEYPDFEAFLKGNFGESLYNLYFKPYNEKIWRTDLASVPMHWLEGKLPMPDLSNIIFNNITRSGEKEMVHSTFYYPKNGGSQFIIDRLAEGLTFRTDDEVKRLTYHDGKWSVNGDDRFDKVIYTGDVRVLGSVLSTKDSFTESLLHSVKDLRSNGTSNVLCYTDNTDLSWLYLPDKGTRAHRIIYTGNFSSSNNASDRKTCVAEFSGKVGMDQMKQEIQHLPGNLEAIASNYEPNSYVIQDSNTRSLIRELKGTLRKMNLFLSGRFAEWEYYNMDKAIEAAKKVVETV